MSPRYAAKVDKNQAELVRVLRRFMKVALTHRLGGGFPDLLCCGIKRYTDQWTLLLVEVKDVGKEDDLTDDEREFFKEWAGTPLIIASKPEDVLRWYGWIE